MRSSADNKSGVEGDKCLGREKNMYSGFVMNSKVILLHNVVRYQNIIDCQFDV